MLSIGRNGTPQPSLSTSQPTNRNITASSFQILHAYHSLERILWEFQRRHANFEIVFWDGEIPCCAYILRANGLVNLFFIETKQISIQTEENEFVVVSRALARSMLFNHLLKLPFGVHVFESLDDPLWTEYAFQKKVSFHLSIALPSI